ncbi:MAG: heparan-alpha-glucosaminide N-acetyltransferase domain-containing protein [Ignavibacteriales bacterium]
MLKEKKKNRIVFIDLMRAFAVLMMVQGHTVDTFLADSYRTFDSPFFSFWYFMRGLTAPIFLFTAGTVFSYLFRLNKVPFSENPRAKKGIKRFLLLICLAYLLRYPTPYIVYFKDVTSYQWQTFFAVDVLHLIAFGILSLVGLFYLAERFKIRDSILFSTVAFISFSLYPVFSKINWGAFLPLPVAGYFYQGTGSIFPLVPWSGFVYCGAVLGTFLAGNTEVFKTLKFSRHLLYASFLFIAISLIGDAFEVAIYNESNFWTTSPNLIFFRLGIVLLLNSVVSYLAIKLHHIPALLVHIGRNTLPIYVVHIVILYGSAWSIGLWNMFAKSFNVWSTIGAALLMITLMISMVQGFQVIKVFIKKKDMNSGQIQAQ